ncbi:helix-turn-helix domain-containing protein [Pleionea litopenaei]|uniref:Helix-turn-helix domain-containing protein n=1 Tax=Pleionea litopenaei TaxID=3070815 RepID=A0AA51RXF2_9GAMM|nr:helix-turn-helix domain-containing protein [Pleionea sp. HL-JVS1]WMS89300.1 helix-turn-helix domain-containing protein [Pleionea sp. HL-JVS1]WMS89321.1 helix-turn-helix domain-containing protein [Pleionea sp. HL-JVS1]
MAEKSKVEKTGEEKAKAEVTQLARRWTKGVIEFGWTGIPNILIENQQRLELNSIQFNILVVLLKHWWEKSNHPFPSKKTIAEITGKDRSTVQRNIREMEARGLIAREKRSKASGGQDSNRYDLTPLVERLKQLAKEQKEIDKQREEEDGRRRRGKYK